MPVLLTGKMPVLRKTPIFIHVPSGVVSLGLCLCLFGGSGSGCVSGDEADGDVVGVLAAVGDIVDPASGEQARASVARAAGFAHIAAGG